MHTGYSYPPFPSTRNAGGKGGILVFLAVAIVSAAAYASTLMAGVSGGDSPYTVDTGEFQVALAEWGTVHHTGYPLYMLLGSPFVAALHRLGVPPSAGASVFSLAWEALAAGGAALLLLRLTRRPWPAVALVLAFACTRSVWVHGAIAEVYSLSLALMVALLWLALDLAQGWDSRRAWLLALLSGIGVAHHRLIAVALPVVWASVALSLTPSPSPAGRGGRARAVRWLAVAIALCVLGFLPYLDMPLRVWRGATWVYGRPDTWQGFWFLFWGAEVEGWQRPVLEAGALLANARQTITLLGGELTWPGLVAAVAGTVLALWERRTRRAAALLAGVALSYVAFTVLVIRAVLPEANLIAASLCLVLGLGLGLREFLSQRREERKDSSGSTSRSSRLRGSQLRASSGAHFAMGIALFLWPVALLFVNRAFITSITRDPAGVDYIAKVSRLEAPPGAVVMAPWGWRYFALSYAQRVEGRFPGWQIVDHRADFAALAGGRGEVYTSDDSFYIFTADDFWAPRLGGAHLSSAGPGLVRVAARPEMRPPDAPTYPLGDGLALVSVEARPLGENEWDIVVVWTATDVASKDYSTFVHIGDREQISSPDDLIGQSDQVAPVYAWYATGRWTPGELVREDHLVVLPPDRPPKLIVVGMYTRDEAGNFVNLGSVEVRKNKEKWAIVG